MPKLGDSRASPSSWFGIHVWPHLNCVLGQNLYINWTESCLKLNQKLCGLLQCTCKSHVRGRQSLTIHTLQLMKAIKKQREKEKSPT